MLHNNTQHVWTNVKVHPMLSLIITIYRFIIVVKMAPWTASNLALQIAYQPATSKQKKSYNLLHKNCQNNIIVLALSNSCCLLNCINPFTILLSSSAETPVHKTQKEIIHRFNKEMTKHTNSSVWLLWTHAVLVRCGRQAEKQEVQTCQEIRMPKENLAQNTL